MSAVLLETPVNHMSPMNSVIIKLFDWFVRSEPNKQNGQRFTKTMASAFPLQPSVDYTPRDRTEIVIGSDEHATVLQALSSDTAQELLDVLSDGPGTASTIADAVDTSIQNAQYHLDRLGEAGLIETVDTWYSSKGREMTVYGLAAEEFVIQFSANRPRSSRDIHDAIEDE